jgi:hypothetical protein
LITVYLRRGESIEVPHGTAVTATTLPAQPGNTPAQGLAVVAPDGKPLAVFRVAELAGYDLSSASADA